MEGKILDFKDYKPPKLDEIATEYKTYILEDIAGVKFQFKHRVPTTSEVIEYKRVTMALINDGKNTVRDGVKAFDFITDKERDFNCLPNFLTVDILTEESIEEVVNGFCRRV